MVTVESFLSSTFSFNRIVKMRLNSTQPRRALSGRHIITARRALSTHVLPTAIDTNSIEFKERANDMKVLEDQLKALLLENQCHPAGQRARERVVKAGKLLVRER